MPDIVTRQRAPDIVTRQPRAHWPNSEPPTRAGDEAYALIREALVTSGDIIPASRELLNPQRPEKISR